MKRGHEPRQCTSIESDTESDDYYDGEIDTPQGTPPKTKKLKKYEQQYLRDWEKEECFRNWLQQSAKGSSFAYCKACRTDLKISAGGRKDLLKHGNYKKHLTSCSSMKGQTQINFKKVTDISRNVSTAEMRLVGFLAEHNIPMNTADHLMEVCKTAFPDSEIAKKLKCDRTKTTAIICNVFGAEQHDNVVTIMQANKFSLIVDESTDCGTIKHLVLLARTFYKNEVRDLFYGLVPVPNATATELYKAVVNSFEKDRIDYKKNLIGFASDGANVMMGKNNSLSSLLQSDIPDIFLLKCVCHSFHLCASHACLKLPEYVENFLRDIYNYFKNSYKRIKKLEDFQHFVNVKPHKLLYPSQTRWLSLKMVVDRVLEQYNALKLFFQSEALEPGNDTKQKAAAILAQFHDPVPKLYLQFLQFILPVFVDLNKLMQSKTSQIYKLQSEIETATRTIMNCYISDEHLRGPVHTIDHQNPRLFKPMENTYFGAKVAATILTSNSLGTNDIHDFKLHCLEFYIESLNQINKRFNLNDELFKSFDFLDPTTLKKYDSVVPLAIKWPNLIPDSELQCLDTEYRILKNMENLSLDGSAEQFWVAVKKIKNSDDTPRFPTLSNFMLTLLSLPHSSAACERIFSEINLMKTKQRNRMSTNTIVGLVGTKQYIDKANCYDFKLDNGLFKKMKNIYD